MKAISETRHKSSRKYGNDATTNIVSVERREGSNENRDCKPYHCFINANIPNSIVAIKVIRSMVSVSKPKRKWDDTEMKNLLAEMARFGVTKKRSDECVGMHGKNNMEQTERLIGVYNLRSTQNQRCFFPRNENRISLRNSRRRAIKRGGEKFERSQ